MKRFSEWLGEGEGVNRRDLLTPKQIQWLDENILRSWWVTEEGEVATDGHVPLIYDAKGDRFPVQFADVKIDFDISFFRQLTTLEGSPKRVGRDFDAASCEGLTTLVGGPEEVGGSVNLTSCSGLVTLEGIPQKIGGDININDCGGLRSLEGLSKTFGVIHGRHCSKLPQVEQEFLESEELQDWWKKSPLDWKRFMYTSGAAKGRKYGL